MKTLTIYQPFAEAIVDGLKHYETRPRRTSIRGRVAIHAGKKRISFDPFEGQGVTLPAPDPLHYGAVIGTVEIVDCVPVEAVKDKLDLLDRLLGDFRPGRFAYVLKNPVKYDVPVPARGRQGWWDWESPWKREPEAAEQEKGGGGG